MVKKELQVVVAGHICFNVIPAFRKTDKTEMKDILIPGRFITMGSAKVSTRGPVSNTDIALYLLVINTNHVIIGIKTWKETLVMIPMG